MILKTTRTALTLRWSFAAYIALLVALPMGALLVHAFSSGWGGFVEAARNAAAVDALTLTIWTSLLVGAINIVFGTLTAWTLVRYRFPGRTLLSGLVDLPLAVPTLVAGVTIALLYGPTSFLGTKLTAWDIDILFARPAIILALLFVTFPFVVRAVEPVLEEIEPAEEEAARSLGAGALRTFNAVFLPAIFPAALSAGVRSAARALGEFGSIVVVAGNIPFKTLTAPVMIFGEIESGASQSAATISTILLLLALSLYGGAWVVERRLVGRYGKA